MKLSEELDKLINNLNGRGLNDLKEEIRGLAVVARRLEFGMRLYERPKHSYATKCHGRVIGVGEQDWLHIQDAAKASNWIPPEYMQSDWVSDVCRYLKGGER